MAQLRIYYQNKENMLELVRYQKSELKKVSGGEDIVELTSSDIIREENKRRRKFGTLASVPSYSIPYPQIKKIANFKNRHSWGL